MPSSLAEVQADSASAKLCAEARAPLQEEREARLAAAAGQPRLWSHHAAERHDVHDPEWQPRRARAPSGNSGFWRHHHHSR